MDHRPLQGGLANQKSQLAAGRRRSSGPPAAQHQEGMLTSHPLVSAKCNTRGPGTPAAAPSPLPACKRGMSTVARWADPKKQTMEKSPQDPSAQDSKDTSSHDQEEQQQQMQDGQGQQAQANKATMQATSNQASQGADDEHDDGHHPGDHAGLPQDHPQHAQHAAHWHQGQDLLDEEGEDDATRQVEEGGDAPEVPSYAHTVLGAPYEPPLKPGTPEWRLHMPATKSADKDEGTPDEWVNRSTALLRRTGKHPLNAEPSMRDLVGAGFITPTALHYVRNHAAVPHIQWKEHRINVTGLVDKPLSLTMDELVAMPSITIPVTLVCSGNRRQEVNEQQQSNAYGWGPCVTSTQFWTGVRLRDVLLKAGAQVGPEWPDRHVLFSGPEKEVSKGDGNYETSMPWSHAMDPGADVLLAYKQNGRWLAPDHGFPVRMLIPGWIGGRMVKWLSEIKVSEEDSRNYYHLYDNRMLPPNVQDHETGVKEGWWESRDHWVTELNINSMIARPAQDEVFKLDGSQKAQKVWGYAYAGRGSRVTRVEVSLDGGMTWRLTNIKRHEKPNAYGKYWCWVLWETDIPAADLLGAKEMQVRAWDQAMNTQPAVLSWNLLGIMNNSCYRVEIHPHTDESGALGLRFQHPAPGEKGALGHKGWLEERAKPAQEGEKQDQAAEPKKGGRKISMAEVNQHKTREQGVWFVREGKVYDPTPFLDQHPGGADAILASAGEDATEEWNAIHPPAVIKQLEQYYIGDLVPEGEEEGGQQAEGQQQDGATVQEHKAEPEEGVHERGAGEGIHAQGPVDKDVALHPQQKVKLKLAERIEVNHNTRIFRFALPSPEQRMGLPCGNHVMVYGRVDDQLVIRPYTPISLDEDKGHLDLCIKVYFANEDPKFPQGGKMSQYMDKLKVGDELEFKGPVGEWVYEGKGQYTRMKTKAKADVSHMSMVAGGTGITPIYQVLTKVLRDPEDKTQLSLLYANKSPDDVLLRGELDKLAKDNPDRFKVWYVVDKAEGVDWPFSTGRISEQLMRDKLFQPSGTTLALMCGPPGLIEHAAKPGFKAMGYDEGNYVLF